jgi:flagellar biosynthetic protein FliP
MMSRFLSVAMRALPVLVVAFLPMAAFAQAAGGAGLNINFGDLAGPVSGSASARIIQLILLITVLALAPSILIMATSFTRIVVVLSFLRSAMGLQTTPPNQVLVSLAMFLTLFIMMPVFEKSYQEGILPLIQEQITEEQAIERSAEPFRQFMLSHVRDKDLELFMQMRPDLEVESAAQTPYHVLIPAFMLTELKRAFEIGFLVFVPFLIIDMLVASVLMSMGMMMLPPVLISLPFKLIFFVLVDGWYMIAGSLARSYGIGG